MAMEWITSGGFVDGEQKIDSLVADTWFGGQPGLVAAAGAFLVKSLGGGGDAGVTVCKTYGLFKNRRGVDESAQIQLNDSNIATTEGPINTTFVVGPAKVRFFTDGTDAAPFVYPGTGGGGWAVGNEIYVNTAGLWDNAAAGTGDKAFGKVLKAPTSATDDMIVAMYGQRTTA